MARHGIRCVRIAYRSCNDEAAHPFIYRDWVALAALEIILGVVLEKQAAYGTLSTFVLLILSFAALGTLKLWLGITFAPGKASASLTAGGLAGLFCLACLLVDRYSELGIGVQTIISTDLVITGFSIIGVGASLRPPTTGHA
ncbi:hypothetical protein [Brucella intermedia]|uniref:hypothetical protein n=1 Tax=Brucella intermedia TaxID=94625 RepID=UPI00224A556B|nr:hypothetical protein [Brucella intermedia]